MEERRRSTRVTGILPVVLGGVDMEGQRFREVTWTISLNRHGAKASTFRKLARNDRVTLQCFPTDEPVEARVAWCDYSGKGYVVGIEMAQPNNVWGLTNPPDDWDDRKGPENRARDAGMAKSESEAGAVIEIAGGRDSSAPSSVQTTTADVPGASPLNVAAQSTAELGELFGKIQQALGVTRQSLKVYEDLKTDSARLVASACDRIRENLDAQVESLSARAFESFSGHLSGIVQEAEQGLARVRQEHEERIQHSSGVFEEKTKATLQGLFDDSRQRISEHVQTASDSIRSQSDAAEKGFSAMVEQTKKEIDEYVGQAREKCHQDIQMELAAGLSACRLSSESLLENLHRRLLQAANLLFDEKLSLAVPDVRVTDTEPRLSMAGQEMQKSLPASFAPPS